MALITTPKAQRAVLEQQTARELQDELGYEPSQTEIYQKAYSTAYPVFADDYNVEPLKQKAQAYMENVYDAAGNIRKGVMRPTTEKRYKASLESVFGEGEYDPLTRKRIVSAIMKQRQTALNNQFAQRYGQYQVERSQNLFDYKNALANQQSAEQAAAQAEQSDLDFQRQLMLRQASRSSGGGSAKKQTDPNEVLAYTQLIANGSIDFSQVPSNLRNDVAETMVQYNVEPYQKLNAVPSFDDYLNAISSNMSIDTNDPNILNQLRIDYNNYLIESGFKKDISEDSSTKSSSSSQSYADEWENIE